MKKNNKKLDSFSKKYDSKISVMFILPLYLYFEMWTLIKFTPICKLLKFKKNTPLKYRYDAMKPRLLNSRDFIL